MSGVPVTIDKSLSASSGRKLILLVDDDPNIRALVARALSPLYDIRQAADGVEGAVELAKLPSPDLIILDIMMPNVDGLALAAQAKGDRRLRSIPIIFLTAKASPSDMIKGIQAGARAYLTKPFRIEALRERVAKALA
jgi:DNA-binding response OmpR family regulator